MINEPGANDQTRAVDPNRDDVLPSPLISLLRVLRASVVITSLLLDRSYLVGQEALRGRREPVR